MDKTWISAQQVVLNDGMNSAFKPDQIGQNQAAWGLNATIRDGKAKTRDYKLVQRATMPKGLVQGVGYFSQQNGVFVASIWGQLWRIVPSGVNIAVDSIPLAWRNGATNAQAWFCETAGSLVIQDNESAPIIFDGSTARRSNIFGNEVPIGSMMAYGNGRLAVVVDNNNVEVGNITSNVFQSELQFTETTYLSGGGAFFFNKPVAGLAFLPVNNTATGFGSLVVLGQRYANTLGLQITARELWDTIPGFEQVLLPTIGVAGQAAIVSVNQDLYWRSNTGDIWSLRSAEWDALSPGNAPISREVARITDYETESLLTYSSGIFFDNRILFLASPTHNIFGGVCYSNIISLDAAPLATMRGKSPPSYDGVAGGLQFTSIFAGQIEGVERAFVISTDVDLENRLWEIMPNTETDAFFFCSGSTMLSSGSTYIASGSTVLVNNPVTTYVETRRFDFQLPGQKKQIMRCDLWPTDIQDTCEISVYWRADNRTQWNFWDTVTVCAQMTNNDGEWLNLAAQERGQVISLSAPGGNDNIDNQALTVGYGFQVRIVWNGYLLMDRIQLWARPLDQTAYSNIPDITQQCLQNVVTNNDITYSIPVGGLGDAYNDQAGNVYVDQYGIPYTQQPPA